MPRSSFQLLVSLMRPVLPSLLDLCKTGNCAAESRSALLLQVVGWGRSLVLVASSVVAVDSQQLMMLKKTRESEEEVLPVHLLWRVTAVCMTQSLEWGA